MIVLETIAYSLGVIAITFVTLLFLMGGPFYAHPRVRSGEGTGDARPHRRLSAGGWRKPLRALRRR